MLMSFECEALLSSHIARPAWEYKLSQLYLNEYIRYFTMESALRSTSREEGTQIRRSSHQCTSNILIEFARVG